MDTGGVPLTGYKLYQVLEGAGGPSAPVLAYDGTGAPEVLQTTLTGLNLDDDYSFYVTALNPAEGSASESSGFRLGGRPGAPGQITEVPDSRTGTRIGLEWTAPADEGGSPILAYTLAMVTENDDDVVMYYGAANSAVVLDLTTGSTYWFKVKATSAVGDGNWSALSTFLIADAPSPPFNVQLTAFDNTLVTFTWS